ncbi:MAG: rane protein of unknown function [Candidatus Saccharibacteria bacterium]|nr:rane protein of unknown function [Candidatus Saccharibacteria bacterium]
MLKKLKMLITAAFATALFTLPLAVPQMVGAQCLGNDTSIDTNLQCGACLNTSDSTCNGAPDPTTRVNHILTVIINVFSLIVGVVSVIFVIIGGLKYITSSGDAGNVSSAQKTIIYALVGLVVVALAQIIVRFVLAKATGA